VLPRRGPVADKVLKRLHHLRVIAWSTAAGFFIRMKLEGGYVVVAQTEVADRFGELIIRVCGGGRMENLGGVFEMLEKVLATDKNQKAGIR
jgi:hypothetical protein